MEKVLVVGCPGGGKSTFAARLRGLTGLPLYHLDQIWHRPDRTTITPGEFDRQLAALLARERWIIDGNYQRTLELRLQACDTVFFLDYPTALCLEGALARVGKPHPDLPWVETRPDPDFLQAIRDFPIQQRPALCALLARYREGRRMFAFQDRGETEAYLQALAAAKGEERHG